MTTYSNWAQVQRTLQRAELDTNALLRFKPDDKPVTGCLIGRPVLIQVTPDPVTGELRATKPSPDEGSLLDIHMLINFFVPWLGICKVLAGNSQFMRRVIAATFQHGRDEWYSVTPHGLIHRQFDNYSGHNIAFEHEGPITFDARQLVSLVMPYPITDTALHQHYVRTLEKERLNLANPAA